MILIRYDNSNAPNRGNKIKNICDSFQNMLYPLVPHLSFTAIGLRNSIKAIMCEVAMLEVAIMPEIIV